MSVQELWQNLEAVFNTSSTAKDFPEEAVKFASTHKSWVKLMRAAHQTKSVLLCCTGGDSPREGQLATIARGLEDCKKSLASYLVSKRLVREIHVDQIIIYRKTLEVHCFWSTYRSQLISILDCLIIMQVCSMCPEF